MRDVMRDLTMVPVHPVISFRRPTGLFRIRLKAQGPRCKIFGAQSLNLPRVCFVLRGIPPKVRYLVFAACVPASGQ